MTPQAAALATAGKAICGTRMCMRGPCAIATFNHIVANRLMNVINLFNFIASSEDEANRKSNESGGGRTAAAILAEISKRRYIGLNDNCGRVNLSGSSLQIPS